MITEFFRFRLRDVIEVGMVLVAVVLWLTGGFSKTDRDVSAATSANLATSHDVVELAKTVAQLATTVHEVDVHGTRYSTQALAVQDRDIQDNKRRIETLEGKYQVLFDIMNDVKSKISILVPDKKR